MELNGFDATKYNNDFEPIPPGDYQVMITGASEAVSKNNDTYLSIEYTVMNGDFKSRKIYDRLFLWSPVERNAEIAKSVLASICVAVNVLRPKRSEELLNKALVVRVKNNDAGYINVVRRMAFKSSVDTESYQSQPQYQQHQYQSDVQQPQYQQQYQQPQQGQQQQTGYQNSPWGQQGEVPF